MKTAKRSLGSSCFLKLSPLAACCLALAGPANAAFVSQGIDPLYSFTGGNDGGNPAASLIQASDGSLYGTSSSDGTFGNGTVFRVSTNGFTALYSFTGGNDGGDPAASLIQASDGCFYGTTLNGGTNDAGTVFQISTNGSFISLYSFTGGNDGANPAASLLQASDGYLYGTTWDGGTNDAGAVFQISTNGAFTSIYSFTGGNDGANPAGSLIQAVDGYLYGTAQNGGTNIYWGTVFKISTNGDFTLLHTFGYDDGGSPEAALLQASDGYLYGTTWNGGTNGAGTVFQISTNGAFTSLYSFTGQNDGANSSASLIQAAGDLLFGTASGGGNEGKGTVFVINPTNGHFTALCWFTGAEDGGDPTAGLVQASDGNFYGTAWGGGNAGNGAVFVLDPLQITPRNFLVTGPSGGLPTEQNLTLINLGASSLNWGVANSTWLNFSPSSGTLPPGKTFKSTVSPTSAADNLAPGVYSAILDFTNLTDGAAQSAHAGLQVLLSPLAFFPGSDGANPCAPLIQTSDGSLYGTTANGGNYNAGTVFRISPDGALTTLYSFTGGNDGANPVASLIQGTDGLLFGTTSGGGTSGNGTVFQISITGSLTSLYSFIGAEDGGGPTASLVQASDGSLYGTASGGDFFGTIFRITTNGEFTLVYSFTGADDGAFPEAALIQASDGYLYGTANQGGMDGVGTVFRVSTNGDFNTLVSFNGTDGAGPAAALIQGSDGYLYGTTVDGDRNSAGTIFRISTNGTFNALQLFNWSDGANPNAGLIQAGDGDLYGIASGGGNYGNGAVFRISSNGSFTPLYSFTGGNDGGDPNASLFMASDGYCYGTANGGGTNGYGTVFRIGTNGAFTLLHDFTGTIQAQPSGALLVSGGNLYGTTQGGGADHQGSIYQVNTNGTLTTLFSFAGGTGVEPEGGLIQASDGYFYGTTWNGGTNNAGTVFRISTNGSFTPLYSFTGGSGGANPDAALVQAGNGYLYGTTWEGGTNGAGTLFQISPDGAFTSLYSFTGGNDGAHPAANLIQAVDGNLYGTAQNGGSNIYWGTVFKISTKGDFTLLHTFGYDDGGSPEAALLQASDGYLYGTTWNGGTNGAGTVFQISTNGAFTSLYSFTGQSDGANSSASLIQAANGDLYGTTSLGGISGFGTVFQITTSGAFTSLYSFGDSSDGEYPTGSLVAFDGYLCGTTQSGGANGNGTVFALLIPQTTGQPVTIELLSLAGGNMTLSFPTASSQNYTVQKKSNLATGDWILYTNFIGNGSPFQLVVPVTNTPAGFFRVSEP